jgi:hypothetical protein
MRFSFLTALITGIINSFFQISVIFAVSKTPSIYFKGDALTTFIQYIMLGIFGLMAILLFVSASKIKSKMKAEQEKEIENAFLNA